MIVAIIETDLGGHRITYLKSYALALLSEGHEVHIYSPVSNEFSNKFLASIHFHKYIVPKSKAYIFKRFDWSMNLYKKWISLSKFIERESPEIDFAFFMSLDFFRFSFGPMIHGRLKFLKRSIDKLVPVLLDKYFNYKWAGLSLQPHFNIDHILYAKNCVAIGLLNENYEFLDDRVNKKKILLPDITNIDSNENLSELGQDIINKSKGRKIICLLGAIAKRKSIIALLDTAQICIEKNYYFLFAGEIHYDTFNNSEIDRIKLLQKSNVDNCYFHFNRIPDEDQFNELIMLSDIVFASYKKFPDSSNLLTKIAYFKKPIIVSDYGIMASRVKKFKLGACIEEGLSSEIIKSIELIDKKFDIQHAKFSEYYSQHSIEFLRQMLSSITTKV